MAIPRLRQRINALGVVAEQLQAMREDDSLLQEAKRANPWFTPALVRSALQGLQSWLAPDALHEFAQRYPEVRKSEKVGIIMAGNVPLVGFHDLLCTWLTGHLPVIKPSSRDRSLVEALLDGLPKELPFVLTDALAPSGIDRLIATGSDNTGRYIRHRFASVPTLLRGNRFSVAVLNGSESPAELRGLARDILLFHGMGCRSVSSLIVPPEWRPEKLLEAIDSLPKALFSRDWEQVILFEAAEKAMLSPMGGSFACSRIILEEASDLQPARLGRLRLIRLADSEQIDQLLSQSADRLQVVVGREASPGQAQLPKLDDFADGIDTMSWLSKASGAEL